jgi:hypothetical protein
MQGLDIQAGYGSTAISPTRTHLPETVVLGDMHTRRATLGALAAGVTALAGCSLLDDATGQEADPAAVTADAVGSTEFEHDSLTSQAYEQTVEVGDRSQDLQLTNWTNRYVMSTASVDIDAIRFSLFTTPTVTVAGESANPFGQFDRERLLRRMVDRVDIVPIENIQMVGERPVTVLGESVTVDEFEAETEQQGVRIRLHIADRTHEGDLLVLLGLHPDLLDLTDDIDTLAEGIVHPSEQA